ncbi:MAG TPA: translation initiation factor IF-2 [Synergistaceae bacterium]|nr:translation initiation factor IF-2 [Synergistaceae bacterium]HQH77434.1 translation initiation factor IF-2 [Synergistaceae bacterium]HQK23994.1 translation initiation factor IF-2 [Synergistaceae bacterium]
MSSKIRVYELAKILGVSNKELMGVLKQLEIEVSSHMSSIDTELGQKAEDFLKRSGAPVVSEAPASGQSLVVPLESTVAEVASLLRVTPGEAVKALVTAGMMIPANAKVDERALDALGKAFGVSLGWAAVAPEESTEEKKTSSRTSKADEGKHVQQRPPIVTVMGHVDHGKTTLLDCIRKTNVSASEAGGITQHIGASVVEFNGEKIVFLDTPGHEAFTAMRARGAQVTDIAILVVAADDGLKPQTVEAMNHAKAAGVPIIVAVNKIDKPDAKPDRVRQQLSDHGLVPEEWGGETVMVEVSAKKGIGVEQLLEMVVLVAELRELRADPTVDPVGTVIEAKLDKGKGPVATVIVQEGTLMRGDIVLTETRWGRVRAMLDDRGKPVDLAGPSIPVEIMGLDGVPQPGERFRKVMHEKEARDQVDVVIQEQKVASSTVKRLTLEEIFDQMQTGSAPLLNLVLKCDVIGSLEALRGSLQKLATDEVGINIVHEGVGRISESDVMLAAASNAIIMGFNVRPDSNATKIAEGEGVQVRLYRVIYDIIDDVRAALEGMLAPTLREQILGEVEIRAVFKVPKSGKVAGCYVTRGVIKRNARVRLIREGVVSWEGTLSDLKRFKDDVREVAAGYECGLSFNNFQDFREGDVVEAYEIVQEKRTLDG